MPISAYILDQTLWLEVDNETLAWMDDPGLPARGLHRHGPLADPGHAPACHAVRDPGQERDGGAGLVTPAAAGEGGGNGAAQHGAGPERHLHHPGPDPER